MKNVRNVYYIYDLDHIWEKAVCLSVGRKAERCAGGLCRWTTLRSRQSWWDVTIKTWSCRRQRAPVNFCSTSSASRWRRYSPSAATDWSATSGDRRVCLSALRRFCSWQHATGTVCGGKWLKRPKTKTAHVISPKGPLLGRFGWPKRPTWRPRRPTQRSKMAPTQTEMTKTVQK